MKAKKTLLVLAAVLLCLTAVLAVAHLITRERIPEGSLLIEFNGQKGCVQIDALDMSEVNGSVVNARGEVKTIHQPGVLLADVLRSAGIEGSVIHSVCVVADDAFSAELMADEVNAPDMIYLAKEPDGSMKLIVFGDSDLKRNVRNVVKLIVQ